VLVGVIIVISAKTFIAHRHDAPTCRQSVVYVTFLYSSAVLSDIHSWSQRLYVNIYYWTDLFLPSVL